MNEEHRLDSLERFNISTEQCLEHCKKVGCLSFTHISSTGTCSVHFGHKYTPEFRKWWIKGTDASAISYQRLCFKGLCNNKIITLFLKECHQLLCIFTALSNCLIIKYPLSEKMSSTVTYLHWIFKLCSNKIHSSWNIVDKCCISSLNYQIVQY